VVNKQETGEADMSGEKLGEFVRRERGAKDIGLREMAKMIGLSPTYLSKVERDEVPPPAEDKVKAIAQIIKRDTDELLARAGRVSSDLSDIITRQASSRFWQGSWPSRSLDTAASCHAERIRRSGQFSRAGSPLSNSRYASKLASNVTTDPRN
jgi:transcriptional regulator with XRE-family HTH domain